MNTVSDLIRPVARLIRARKATTFYLNGAPGSGKTYALSRVADLLPNELGGVQVLGPYHVHPSEEARLCEHILADCKELGFVEPLATTHNLTHLADIWLWLGTQMQARTGQQFLVLTDVDYAEQPDLSSLATLFSSARYLESRWDEQTFGVHIVLASYWDESLLEAYFRQIQTSFPYSKERNSATWEGVSCADIDAMVLRKSPNEATPTHGRVLYELTSGHPAVANDVLSRVSLDQLSISTLLAATEQAASDGEPGARLLTTLLQLHPDCRTLLRNLVLRRQIAVSLPDPSITSLMGSGVVKVQQLGEQTYLGFRSWYAEILVRSHLEHLGIADPQTAAVRHLELIPEIHCVNEEAYRLIHETENMARNFVAAHLCLVTSNSEPILRGRYKRLNINVLEDSHQRASDWKARSRDRNLPVDLNPLLAFCSTSDLAGLISEIATELRSTEWRNISNAIGNLSEIRNSVMHNQLIDDSCLDKLYKLQASVWEAVGRTSIPAHRRAAS